MVDIDKVLNLKPKIKLKAEIFEQYWGYFNIFDEIEINQLPLIRGQQINHEIELLRKNTRRSFRARYTKCQRTNFWV